MTIISSKIC